MKKTIFTREELYELVWSKPINKIAKEHLLQLFRGLRHFCFNCLFNRFIGN